MAYKGWCSGIPDSQEKNDDCKNNVEVDIDLWLYNVASSASYFCNNNVYKFKISENDNGSQDLFVRYMSDENLTENVNDLGCLIIEFLSGLENLLSFGKYTRGELRLGIYYDPEVIMAFSVCLSGESIRKLSQHNLSFESILYPCSDL